MSQNFKIGNGPLRNVVIGAIAVTIALSPWLNSDSLIIPKAAILFCIGCYLIPILIRHKSVFKNNKNLQILLILSLIFVLQMIFYCLSLNLLLYLESISSIYLERFMEPM